MICFFTACWILCTFFQDDEFAFHGIAYVDMSPLIYPGGVFLDFFL